MTTKTKKGLGRGLSALIPGADMEFLSRVARGELSAEPVARAASDGSAVEPHRGSETIDEATNDGDAASTEARTTPNGASAGVSLLALDDIEANPYQPRRTFSADELADLTASIREHGVLQPILVRPANGATPYQLVAGERRWRAARAAGLTHVSAIVRQVEDQQALELALIENVQRHDISPLDAALAYKRLSGEFALSQEQIAARVGKSRASVANTMRLLDLPEEARAALESGELSEGHGRAILMVHGEAARRVLTRRIRNEQLSVREAESFAREVNQHEPQANLSGTDGHDASASENATGARQTPANIDWRNAEEELQKRLEARVKVRPRARGGQIVIDYADADDFDRLFALFGERASSKSRNTRS